MTQSVFSPPDRGELEVLPDPDGLGAAVAVAFLYRDRAAEHEELWVQLFVDGVFEDVKRAVYIDEEAFVARFLVPNVYRDGSSHHAQVRFIRVVSRIIPIGSNDRFGAPMVQTPEAVAEADFVSVAAKR